VRGSTGGTRWRRTFCRLRARTTMQTSEAS
jgi:hypothetical protein